MWKRVLILVIILVESDPVVRMDLSEALVGIFPDATIRTADKLENIGEDHYVADVVILDTPHAEILAWPNCKFWIDGNAHVILTHDTSDLTDIIHSTWRKLQRPFSEQMLLNSLPNAI